MVGPRTIIATLTVLASLLSLSCLGRLLWPQPDSGEAPSSAAAQLGYLKGRIATGEDARSQQRYPEGHVFTNVLYGLSWTQLAATEPADAELRGTAIREAMYALERADTPQGRAVFTAALSPPYGIFYASWMNWLRGSVLSLQPPNRRDRRLQALYDATNAQIARAFAAASIPYLMSYPNRAWPVDSAVGIAALAMSDRLSGKPTYRPTITRWLAGVRSQLEPDSGLPPHEVDVVRGTPLAGARGGSTALLIRFLSEVDTGLARQLYARWSRQFVVAPLGFGPAVREYPRGISGTGDVDSGPLLGGISLSASVIGLAAARLQNDEPLAKGLGGVGELLGLPIRLPGAGKRYLFGAVPLGDLFLVWAQTARPMVGRFQTPLASDPPGPGRWMWVLALLVLPVLFGLSWAQSYRRSRRPRLPAEIPEILSDLRPQPQPQSQPQPQPGRAARGP